MTSILWNQNLENSFYNIYSTIVNSEIHVIELGCFEGFGTLKLNELFGSHEKVL